ncbi:MAG TPA: hypothetical protein ENF26_03305 [Methanomicrobia archaeon]|nr:hypothetical protein [Methanomicrobia archaeon]HEX59158.1 hypothetical protein [Methanomicrobia archaeon]
MEEEEVRDTELKCKYCGSVVIMCDYCGEEFEEGCEIVCFDSGVGYLHYCSDDCLWGDVKQLLKYTEAVRR